jgi:hypothetical protein
MRMKPSIEDPSNAMPFSRTDSNFAAGISTFLGMPKDIGKLQPNEIDAVVLDGLQDIFDLLVHRPAP